MPDDQHKHELQRVAEKLVSDLSTSAKAAAEKMLGSEGGPGGVKETRAVFLDYVRRNATQPEPAGSQWRLAFLQQMIVGLPNPYAQAEDGSDTIIPARNGVEHCESLIKELWPLGYAPPPPPPPPSPLDALVQGGPMPAGLMPPPPPPPAVAPGPLATPPILEQPAALGPALGPMVG